MAYDQLMSSYVGRGTHAARPASPNVASGVAPIYYETDTTNTFVWTGSAWVQINGGGGSAALSVSTKTTTYTITSSDDVILADASGGAFTVSLPTAVGWTKRITVIKIDSSANAVTVGTTGGQTINGPSSRLLAAQFSGTTLVSDNANWRRAEQSLPLTSKGDLLVGLASQDVQRLAVGADTYVLTADSAQATGVKWAASSGAVTALADTTVAGTATASIDLTSISGAYRHLQLVISGAGLAALGNVDLQLQVNADTGSNHRSERAIFSGASSLSSNQTIATNAWAIGYLCGASGPAGGTGSSVVTLPDYASTALRKAFQSYGHLTNSDSAGGTFAVSAGGEVAITAAITRLTLTLSSGNFAAGTRVTLYGYN